MKWFRTAGAGVALLAQLGCGSSLRHATIELDRESVVCYTATRRAFDVRPAPAGDGFWAATEGGLLRFDAGGTLLRKYTRRDGLTGHGVRELVSTSAGDLWIATDGGVSRLKDGRFTGYTTREGLNDDGAIAVAVDRHGRVLVGTERGVSVLEGERFVPFEDTHEFCRRPTYAIHVAGDGSIWFAKENALTRALDGGAWQVFQRDPLLRGPRARMVSNAVRAVATDRRDLPWIGTREGLGHFDGTAWRRVVGTQGVPDGSGPLDNRIVTVAIDREGAIWLGHGDTWDSEGGLGASWMRGDEWRYLSVKDGLPDNRVYRIRVDGDDAKWFATANGVARFVDGRFTVFGAAGELPDNHVRDIVPLGADRVAVITPRGTALFERGEPRAGPPPLDEPRDSAILTPGGSALFKRGEARDGPSLDEARDGAVVTPLGSALLERGGPGGAPSLDAPPDEASRAAEAARAGLDRAKPDLPPGLPRSPVRAAVRDTRGRLWVGTRDIGVWCFDGGRWNEVRLHGQRLPDEITVLRFESDDALWIGSVTEGAMRIDLADRRRLLRKPTDVTDNASQSSVPR